jgi:hypothetical protein
MKGWCPRCDAVREAEGACPECRAPLMALDERPVRPAARQAGANQEEAATEAGAVVEPPPRARLRVALAVAALVLVGLAFVAGRSTGGATARTARRSPSTTQTTAPQAVELQRQLGWRSRPVGGVRVEAVSISRLPSETVNADVDTSDNAGSLSLRVEGLTGGRRLLGVTGLRLVDAGGGVFASPDSRRIGGVDAVPVDQASQGGGYVVDLGPTPALDTLDRIEFDDLLVSASTTGNGQLELNTGGAWPARPPMRAVDPSPPTFTVPVALPARGAGDESLPLRVASAFVGSGRAVVVLSLADGVGEAGRDLGAFPVSVDLRDGGRVVCSRLTLTGQGQRQLSPLLVVDCPASPAPSLTVELAAGIDAVPLGAKLPA